MSVKIEQDAEIVNYETCSVSFRLTDSFYCVLYRTDVVHQCVGRGPRTIQFELEKDSTATFWLRCHNDDPSCDATVLLFWAGEGSSPLWYWRWAGEALFVPWVSDIVKRE